jgi:hypothetical protein
MLDTTLGKIEYSYDEEYRTCIARIFNVPNSQVDDYSFEPIFDDIYARTKDDPFFQKIYLTAAGFMLSEDPCLGVCVLFAYDYAKAFYAVLCDYLNQETSFGSDSCEATKETNEATKETNKATLEKLLERRR